MNPNSHTVANVGVAETDLVSYAGEVVLQPPLLLKELDYEKVKDIISCVDINPILLIDSPGGDFAVYNSLLVWAELTEPFLHVVGEVTSAALLFLCFAQNSGIELNPGVFGTLHSWTFGSDTRALQTTTKELKRHFDNFNKETAEMLALSPRIRKRFLRGEDIFLTTEMIQKLLNREL